MNKQSIFNVPPAEEVRSRLAAATAEVRYLRQLLKLAKSAEQAKSLALSHGGERR